MIPPETKSLFSDGFQVRGHSRAEMLISGGGKASTGGELFSRSKSVPRPTRYAIPGWTSLPCATWSWPETFLQCKSHPRPAAGSIFSLLHSDCVCEQESTGEPALGNEDRPSLKQDGAGISITKHKKSLSFLETEIGECTATVRAW